MSETKTYVFPESGGNGGGSGMMAMLAPLLQQKGIDAKLIGFYARKEQQWIWR